LFVNAFALTFDLLGRGAEVAENVFRHGQRDFAFAGKDAVNSYAAQHVEFAQVSGAGDDANLGIDFAHLADDFTPVLDAERAEHEGLRAGYAGLSQRIDARG